MDNKLYALIAIGIGVVAGLGAGFIVYNTDDSRDVFYVYRIGVDVVGGDRIPTTSVSREEVPSEFSGLKGFAVFDEEDATSGREWMLSQINRCDLPRGSLVPQRCVEELPSAGIDDLIPPDKRAVTLNLDQSTSVGQFVRPGSRVDVLGTTLDANELPKTEVILENVRVVAVDQATTDFAYQQTLERGYRTATLVVTPEQAQVLVNQSELVIAPMSLTLRPPQSGETE